MVRAVAFKLVSASLTLPVSCRVMGIVLRLHDVHLKHVESARASPLEHGKLRFGVVAQHSGIRTVHEAGTHTRTQLRQAGGTRNTRKSGSMHAS